MKKLTYILLGTALAGLAACVDLNEHLVGTVTTQYFSNGAGLDAAVMGDYAQQRGFWGLEQSYVLTEMGTDLETLGDQTTFTWFVTYAGGLSASDGHFTNTWNPFFQAINTSNAVVNRAPAVTDMDPVTKATRIGEAKFLRALDYFMLVQFFGPVPLSTTESQGVNTVAHRSPVDSIYLQIVKDLRSADSVLPAVQNNLGRATKGAAQALLAKVLLTRAYHPYPYEAASPSFYLAQASFLREAGASSATDFAQAKAEADSVINSGTYSLLPVYEDNFCVRMGSRGPGSYCNLPANENNSELIWSVQYSAVAGQYVVGLGNTNFVQMLSYYDDRNGMTRDCNNGRAFRRVRPTLYARNLWNRWTDSTHSTVLDVRYDGTFQSVWLANAATTGACFRSGASMGAYTGANCSFLPTFGTNCTNGQAFLTGDTAMFQPGYYLNGIASCANAVTGAGPCSQAYRQAHKYAVVEPCITEPCPNPTVTGQYDWFRFPTMKKWQDDQRPDFNNTDGGRDVPLLRLGQVYLIAAEAACAAGYGQGNSTCTGAQSAIAPYVDTLASRAANCTISHGCTAAQQTANKAQLIGLVPATINLEWLLDEYGREMYGEYWRWLDLARTGLWHRIVDDNYQASPAHGGFFSEAKHHLRPIPQPQIDNTQGGVAAFPQNPGY
jgi:hypothetical protein